MSNLNKVHVQIYNLEEDKKISTNDPVVRAYHHKFMKDNNIKTMVEDEFYKENKDNFYDDEILNKSGHAEYYRNMKKLGCEIISISIAVNANKEIIELYEFKRIGEKNNGSK